MIERIVYNINNKIQENIKMNFLQLKGWNGLFYINNKKYKKRMYFVNDRNFYIKYNNTKLYYKIIY